MTVVGPLPFIHTYLEESPFLTRARTRYLTRLFFTENFEL
jgi:hypothetical protein